MNVDALVPVTYKCCINYTYSDGIQESNFEPPFTGLQLDDFENIDNWIVGGTNASQEGDTVNFIKGQQGLKLIAKNGNRAYTTKRISEDFSNANNFVIWVYVYNADTFKYTRLDVSSTSNWSRYFYKTLYTSYKQGWNRLFFDKRFFTNVGNDDWNNLMIRMRIQIYPTTGMNTNATVDDLRYNVENEWVGQSQENDIANFKEGQQGLKLISINGSTVYSDLAINKNFSDINNFAMWMYVKNADNIGSISMYLTSNQFNSYFLDKVYDIRSGWNKIVFNKHSFTNYFGEDWNNVMATMRLRIYSIAGQDTNVTFDDLRNNLTGQKALIMFEFDDGYYDLYSNAYPILKANNQTGVSYAIIKNVGKSNYMNVSDFRDLQSNGWDISSHTYNHTHLNQDNEPTLIAELNGSYDWLVNNNFQKSAGFIAYPYGHFNDNVLNNVEKRYILGRAVSNDSAQTHMVEDNAIRYIQRVISAQNGSAVNDLIGRINDVINSKLLGIIMFHHIVDNNNPQEYEYSKTNFKAISDYVKSRENDIEVITNSEYIIPIINKFTPVLNKTTRIYSNGSSILIIKNKFDEYMPNMTVKPIDFIDINITSYDENGGLIKFNESTTNGRVEYSIGDRIPNKIYSVTIHWENGTEYSLDKVANYTGYINYGLEGGEVARYQEIIAKDTTDTSFTVTLPVGYTSLRFNAPNSSVINLDSDGQNNSQSIFNIINYGNINQNFRFSLDEIITNITTYADLDNDHNSGKLEISTTPAMIIPNLNPGANQNVWIIIDSNKAPIININRTLMINNSY